MKEKQLPIFNRLEGNGKVALIDSQNNVCMSISKNMAEKYDDDLVQEKIYEVWQKQVAFQKKLRLFREKINTAYFMITRRCNMKCDFCAINATYGAAAEKEFTLEDIKQRVIPILRQCKPHKLVITGGEPILNNALTDIVDEVSKLDIKNIVLQSNGLLFSAALADRLAKRVSSVDFSTKHMIGSHDLRKKLIENIIICQMRRIPVTLTFIYEKSKIKDLHMVIDMAAEYDTDLIINLVAPIGRAVTNSTMLTDREHIEMLLDIAKYMLEKKYFNEKFRFIFGSRVQVRNSCGAFGSVMAIFPEGNIYLCQSLEKEEFKIGNIYSHSAADIDINLERLLENKKIQQCFCVDKKNVCSTCQYRYLCGGKCPVANDTEDYECIMTKAMIDYQLFIREDKDFKEELEKYIDYFSNVISKMQINKEEVNVL